MKVIICEYHSWDSITRIGNHHYAQQFIKSGWEVLWISHAVSPFHALKSENRSRIARARSGATKHGENITEIIPLTWLPFFNAPILKSKWTLAHSHRFFMPPLKAQLIQVGFDKPDLLWITDTTLHALTEIAQSRALAVRIADDNPQFRNMPQSLRWAEEKLCKQADFIFVTSAPLYERLNKFYKSKVHLLRNAVDYEHFQGTFERPKEYESINAPIAIYVGAIEEWFNIEWIRCLASSRKDIAIVLIGKASIDLTSLADLPNVLYLGPRAYAQIPAYLSHASCGIIPFKRTPLVESVSPLKLFEFLASGLPVVSTRWRELEALGSPAVIVDDERGFAKMVGEAIDSNWKAARGGIYKAYARENSWKARFESAMDIIKPLL